MSDGFDVALEGPDPFGVSIAAAIAGPPGPEGPPGEDGADSTVPGPEGPAGAAGVGVPTGGLEGQVLTKDTATDYDTSWQEPTGGVGGGLSAVTTSDSVTVDFSGDGTAGTPLTATVLGAPPTGPAGGSLSGTYPDPSLSSANLTALAGVTTAANQVTTWTGSGTAAQITYTGDWLTQYPLTAGRTGGLTLIGGLTGAESIVLQGNASSTTAGGINLRSPVRLRDISNETITTSVAPLLRIRQTRTIDFANAEFGGGPLVTNAGLIALDATIAFNQSTAAFASVWLKNLATYKNVSGVTANLGAVTTIESRWTATADTASITLAPIADFFSAPTLNVTGGGTLSSPTDLVNFEGTATIGTGVTVALLRAFVAKAPTVTGTVTQYRGMYVEGIASGEAASASGLWIGTLQTTGTNIGIDVAAPSGGTTNIGIRSAGSILHTGTTGIGYGVGAGGTITQTGSRTTAVICNELAGAITLFAAAGSTTIASFTVTNNTVAANDTILLVQKSGTDKYRLYVTAVAAGSFQISFATLAGTTNESPVFNFCVLKGSTT